MTDALLSNLAKIEPDYIREIVEGNVKKTFLCFLDKQAPIDSTFNTDTIMSYPNWRIMFFRETELPDGKTIQLMYPNGSILYKYIVQDSYLLSYNYYYQTGTPIN